MESMRLNTRLHPAWWTVILLAVIALLVFVTMSLFFGTFTPSVPVTLTSERTGLVMDDGAKVKMRGVLVGRVSSIEGGKDAASLKLEIFPDQVPYIPANVTAQIRATTVFGAKYVDLIYPDNPSPKRLSAGAVIASQNVSTEINTVFENLVSVLHKIDPAKLNAVLTALAEGLRGQSEHIGQATTDANQVLMAVNPRAETIRRDWQALKGFSDTYSVAAQDILTVLDAASTTSATISNNAKDLDALLVNVIGFSRSGIDLIGPNKDNLVNAINTLEPTTSLLMKYDPQLTCTLVGGLYFLENGGLASTESGFASNVDSAVLLGDDMYRYPDNLPINGAKGGPGGKPGCGSLPVVDNNWPVRYLITNTGWGTGVDVRPNPGIGIPGYANYLPATRAVPEPPSIRYMGPPAPGPIPYPGAPAYGADLYADDGTPLWPGLPPAPPPSDQPPPDHAPPGAEPFVLPPGQPSTQLWPATPAPPTPPAPVPPPLPSP
jgi:phospholipid/cholesterol/gamma-HCH transport system substrate-binding protein